LLISDIKGVFCERTGHNEQGSLERYNGQKEEEFSKIAMLNSSSSFFFTGGKEKGNLNLKT